MTDIVERLEAHCNGHPNAKIPWPHRVLHDAISEIKRLRAELAALKEQEPVAAYFIDGTGCEHMSRDVSIIKEGAKLIGSDPDVVYLYAAPVPAEIATTRALEIVLSRVKMDNETARVLKSQLFFERQKAIASHESNTKHVVSQNKSDMKHKHLTKHQWYDALGVALMEIWPEWSIERATKEMTGYVGTRISDQDRTFESAKELARQYVSEFGEQ